MSQHPRESANSSQLHSINSSLHYHRCWWTWCTDNFYSRKDLIDHVNSEHVQKVPPVRLADVPALQKIENVYWDSLDMDSIPTLPSSSPIHPANLPWGGSFCEVNTTDFIPSSLPSPPASSPHEIPTTPVKFQPILPTDPDLLNAHPLLNDPLTPSSPPDVSEACPSSPSFTSLSSSPTRPDYDVPQSPSLDALIAEVTKQSIFTVTETGHPDEVVFFQSAVSSQESVFNQLTQGIVDEKDSNAHHADLRAGADTMLVASSYNGALVEGRFATDSTNQPKSNLLEAPTPLQMQTNQLAPMPSVLPNTPSSKYPFTATTTRQPWYSAPRRRSSKRMPEVRAAQTMLGGKPLVTPIDSPVIADFQPAAAFAGLPVGSAASPTPRSTSPSDDPFVQSQVSSSQTDNSQISSYPPLQTQAPYRSQSMSQD